MSNNLHGIEKPINMYGIPVLVVPGALERKSCTSSSACQLGNRQTTRLRHPRALLGGGRRRQCSALLPPSLVQGRLYLNVHRSIWDPCFGGPGRKVDGVLSDAMFLLISFRNSTPPQKRQLNILVSNGEQQFDDFVGELTFQI